MIDVDFITAGEIRDMGVKLPDNIPNCAQIHRSNIQITPRGVSGDVGNRTLNVDVTMTFLAPFEWIEATVSVRA